MASNCLHNEAAFWIRIRFKNFFEFKITVFAFVARVEFVDSFLQGSTIQQSFPVIYEKKTIITGNVNIGS